MIVRVIVPRSLAEFAAGQRRVPIEVEPGASLRSLIDAIADRYPALARRLVDETGALRRHVNIYIGLEECRRAGGLDADLPEETEVSILGSIAGG